MQTFQTNRLVFVRPLLGGSEALPGETTLLADGGVVEGRRGACETPSFFLREDHKGVHGSFNVAVAGAFATLRGVRVGCFGA